MKVFISWSGELSKRIAEELKEWIKCVLQATEPFISSEDIEKGSMWFTEISDQLAESGVGIICLTSENINAPWILFEAGSLAKGLSKNRVCTFLVNLATSDLQPPLSQFNATGPTKKDMFKLAQTINSTFEAKTRLPEDILRKTFDQFWGSVSAKLKAIVDGYKPPKPAQRSQTEMIEEILGVCRAIQKRVQEGPRHNPWIADSPPEINTVQAYLDSLRRGDASDPQAKFSIKDFLDNLPGNLRTNTNKGNDSTSA